MNMLTIARRAVNRHCRYRQLPAPARMANGSTVTPTMIPAVLLGRMTGHAGAKWRDGDQLARWQTWRRICGKRPGGRVGNPNRQLRDEQVTTPPAGILAGGTRGQSASRR